MQGANRWRVHFVMPSAYTINTLPKPNNPAVQLREVPSKVWAVLSYSSFNTEAGWRRSSQVGVDVTSINSLSATASGRPYTTR